MLFWCVSIFVTEVCAGWAIGVPMVGMPISGKVGVNLFANFSRTTRGTFPSICWRPKKNKELPHFFFSTAYQSQVNQVTKSHRTKVAYHFWTGNRTPPLSLIIFKDWIVAWLVAWLDVVPGYNASAVARRGSMDRVFVEWSFSRLLSSFPWNAGCQDTVKKLLHVKVCGYFNPAHI